MKSKLLICISLFVLLISFKDASAQSFNPRGFSVGLNIANFNPENSRNNDILTHYSFGAFYGKIVNDEITVRTEFNITTKGAVHSGVYYYTSYDDLDYKVIYDDTFSITYFEVPVLIVYSVDKNINFVAGPYAELCVTADEEINRETISVATGESVDDYYYYSTDGMLDQFVRSPEYGFIIGFEYFKGSASLGLRYSAGLTNIFDDNVNSDLKNEVIQVIFAVNFAAGPE